MGNRCCSRVADLARNVQCAPISEPIVRRQQQHPPAAPRGLCLQERSAKLEDELTHLTGQQNLNQRIQVWLLFLEARGPEAGIG